MTTQDHQALMITELRDIKDAPEGTIVRADQGALFEKDRGKWSDGVDAIYTDGELMEFAPLEVKFWPTSRATVDGHPLLFTKGETKDTTTVVQAKPTRGML